MIGDITRSQTPLQSGFGALTTAEEVLAGTDLHGRVAIVTGGHSGIGLETTRGLAAAGARVIVPARSAARARTSLGATPRTEVATLDLSDPASVDAFASSFLTTERRLDILVNNAGIMATPLLRDPRGFESQLATNHLGHFQLVARLWPALRRANGARVVSLSSRAHARSGIDFEDPHFNQRPYDKWLAYGQSKTATALFALALDVRGAARGVRAFSVHPGAIVTDLMRSMDADERAAAVARSQSMSPFKTAEQGAATSAWCATSPRLDGRGGVYCEDVDIAEAVAADFAGPYGVRPWAMDPELAERLWVKSEEWTGVGLTD